MKIFLALMLSAAALTFWVQPAAATCMTSCKATLAFEDCSEPVPADEWPASKLLGFAAACETCCSPPGGPVKCDAEAADPKQFKVLLKDQLQVGELKLTGKSCSDEPRVEFATPLQVGSYKIVHGNTILLQFKATGKAGCTTDADCTGCASCEDGQCKALACKSMCKTDADCGPKSQCITTEPGCCSECQAMAADAGSTDAGGADAGGAGAADAGGVPDAPVAADVPAEVDVPATKDVPAEVDVPAAKDVPPAADVPVGADAPVKEDAAGTPDTADGNAAALDASAGAAAAKPMASSNGCSASSGGRQVPRFWFFGLVCLAGLAVWRARRRSADPLGL